ncbi:MAG TPA: hypothetical protein VH593_14525 [Ktedonobacteraceae bacterium]
MPSYMTALGFPVVTEQDFRHYVYQASEFGQKIETSCGSYTMWTPGSGIELWVQTNLHKRIIGMNPHFRGDASMPVRLVSRVTKRRQSILDGSFLGWAASDSSGGNSYPLVFDLPDYDLYNELTLPCTRVVQVAAFAHMLEGYEDEKAYETVNEREQQADPETFYPSGLFIVHHRVQDPPRAQASLSGYVLATELYTNPVTNQKFYWVLVRTRGSQFDIVADPQVVQGKIVQGGIVKGTFWLSGRLIAKQQDDHKGRPYNDTA